MKRIIRFVSFCVLCSSLTTCDSDESPVPGCVNNIFPLDMDYVAEGALVTLRWEASADAVGYDVMLGEVGQVPDRIASNIKATELQYRASHGMSYVWYVMPRNADGQHFGCLTNKSHFKTKPLPPIDDTQIPVNVLVLCFDPMVDAPEGRKKLHDRYMWPDPKLLASEYIEEITYASHELVNYNIVEWKEIDEFPSKIDGFRYTGDSYDQCIKSKTTCHNPDDLDYYKLFAEHDVANGINNDVYDEVWIFGAPYFGFWESSMAGAGAFYVNGGIYENIASKAFVVMGFSYERSAAEMLHNLCHRTEATMSREYGGWRAEELTTSWARFAANQKQSGVAAVGTCHFPPNAGAAYDYCNDNIVFSSADDWYNYPYLAGTLTPVNASTWGMLNCERDYFRWWFHHLPHRAGTAPDGHLNNWWRYIYELPE